MTKFLVMGYPVMRIKLNGKFKRAIFIENRYYYLSDKSELNELTHKLFEILVVVFNSTHDDNLNVIKKYLNLK